MRDGERLDPGVRVERAQHPSHVVADGVGAQVELLRDLRGRTSVREQVQDLVLAASGAGGRSERPPTRGA
jgi:hypothetical protein